LLQTPAIVFCHVDSLLPVRGKMAPGFDEFTAELEHAAIPNVWVTTRSRLQIDDPRRKLGHNHPFIAEGGCGVYLPEGYFHLRPAKTVRLGRFTCLPVAEPQPAAADALEELSAETGVAAVGDVGHFVAEGANRHWQLRQRGVLWSLAVGANLKQCVRDLSKLYTRALRSQPKIVGIASGDGASELLAACDRGFLLVDRTASLDDSDSQREGLPARFREIDLSSADAWERVVEALSGKS
jgi:hypothetical protein